MKWRSFLWSALLAGAAINSAIAQEPPLAPAQPKVEVDGRGPLHEAFAQPWEKNASANEPVEQQPPQPVPEEPPSQRPDGTNVQWIPGYWQFDDERKDFVWVSGFWRDIPAERRWVSGYWSNTNQGWVWINGHWAAANEADEQIVPPPPENIDNGPNTPAPDDDSFYIPGTWFYTESGYRWRGGYWADCRPGYSWVPARYYWGPRGWAFASGFWDYAPFRRGLLFAPVYFGPRPYFGAGYAFRPSFAIGFGGLYGSLFVRAGYGNYFFGDYYGPRYGRYGYSPWIGFGARGYDPMFGYERWANRGNVGWYSGLNATFAARATGFAPVPPRVIAGAGVGFGAGAGVGFGAGAGVGLGAGAGILAGTGIGFGTGVRAAPRGPAPALVTGLDQVRASGVKLQTLDNKQVLAHRDSAQQIVSQSLQRSQAASQVRLNNAGPGGPGLNRPQGNSAARFGTNPGNANIPNVGGNRPPVGNPNAGGSRPPVVNPNVGGSRPAVVNPNVGGSRPAVVNPNIGGSRPAVVNPNVGGGGLPTVTPGLGGSRPPVSMPNLGGSRPPVSMPNLGGSRPPVSMPNLGGSRPPVSAPNFGGSRPPVSMPNYGGGRPSVGGGGMPNFGGGGARPGGGGGGRPAGGGRPSGSRK